MIAVDDCSSDGSARILVERAAETERLLHLTSPSRAGQLAAWRTAATTAPVGSLICFIDADSMPLAGAVDALLQCVASSDTIVVASGRVIPDAASDAWAAARFRARALHAIRMRGSVRDAVIGRFFAVRRDWFLATAIRTDIIANDAFLAASAARDGMQCRYVPSAGCVYAESANAFDFAAQRQRADAGYRQLRSIGVLHKSDEPSIIDYAIALGTAALGDPLAAFAWSAQQIRAKSLRAYRPAGRDEGAWDVQPSTKRALVDRVERPGRH